MKHIDRQKSIQRKNRGKMVRVALVGYTNVGKSTSMNLLSKSEVFAETNFSPLSIPLSEKLSSTICLSCSPTRWDLYANCRPTSSSRSNPPSMKCVKPICSCISWTSRTRLSRNKSRLSTKHSMKSATQPTNR